MKFQLISDIHLENLSVSDYSSLISPIVETIILAGDIGYPYEDSYSSFLEYCSQNWKYVILILGNHEFYNDEYSQTIKLVSDICNKLDNVHFLNRNIVDIDGIRIAGCTLWSQIPVKYTGQIMQSISDYHCIVKDGYRLSIPDTNQMHEIDRDWLFSLKDGADIIVTHHPPSMKGTSKPEYEFANNRPINHVFGTNLDYSIIPHKYWIYGHTHYNGRYDTLITNQYGYKNENVQGFEQKLIFEL